MSEARLFGEDSMLRSTYTCPGAIRLLSASALRHIREYPRNNRSWEAPERTAALCVSMGQPLSLPRDGTGYRRYATGTRAFRQEVTLTATDFLRLGDPQVITRLPLPDTSSADLTVDVPVENLSKEAITATIRAAFEGVEIAKDVKLPQGKSKIRLTSAEFPELHVIKPRLWWPRVTASRSYITSNSV